MNTSQIPTAPPAPRALLVDDHPIVMDALATALISMHVFASVDKVRTLGDALARLASDNHYALVILDLHLGATNGLDTLIALREVFPDVPVIIFSGDDSATTIGAAFEKGIRGFVPKDSPLDVVVNAVRTVLAGSSYIPPHAVTILGGQLRPRTNDHASAPAAMPFMSPRQRQVFELLLLGMPNKVIASRLEMAEGTVKTHLNTIYRVIGVQSRAQAILRARDFGLV